MLQDPWLNIGMVMLINYAVWTCFFFGMYKRGINHTHGFFWTTLYFLSVAAALSVLFSRYLAPILYHPAAIPLGVLAVFMLGQSTFYFLFPRYFARPVQYLASHPNREYLDITLRRLLAKSADIVAQQVFIVLLVLFLREAGLALYQIIPAFGALFGLLHMPLIASERGAWPSRLFASAVVAFSIIFPPLILVVHYGFVYNIILHWLFYTLTAAIFWIYHSKR